MSPWAHAPTRRGVPASWPSWSPPTAAIPPTLGELRDAVKRVLPAYAAPHEMVLVEQVPRTAIGKVRRTELR